MRFSSLFMVLLGFMSETPPPPCSFAVRMRDRNRLTCHPVHLPGVSSQSSPIHRLIWIGEPALHRIIWKIPLLYFCRLFVSSMNNIDELSGIIKIFRKICLKLLKSPDLSKLKEIFFVKSKKLALVKNCWTRFYVKTLQIEFIKSNAWITQPQSKPILGLSKPTPCDL